MNWTAFALFGFGALMIADLMVFRFVFPAHTAENTIMWVVNGLSWILAVVLLLTGFALMI